MIDYFAINPRINENLQFFNLISKSSLNKSHNNE